MTFTLYHNMKTILDSQEENEWQGTEQLTIRGLREHFLMMVPYSNCSETPACSKFSISFLHISSNIEWDCTQCCNNI